MVRVRVLTSRMCRASKETLWRILEDLENWRRIWNLTRMFNVREGFSRKDDTMPPRMYLDPLPVGRPKNKVVTKEAFEKMLSEYYEIQGWDTDGRPTRETLITLGLGDIVTR